MQVLDVVQKLFVDDNKMDVDSSVTYTFHIIILAITYRFETVGLFEDW